MAKRTLAFVTVALLALAACDDAPETGRTILSILEFNGGSPVQSDVLFDNGTDIYVSEDLVPVTFMVRPYNEFITGTTHDRMVIDRYRVAWTRTDGGTGVPPTREEAASIFCEMGEETDAFIRMVSWGEKSVLPLSALANSPNQISMRADITFFGHETGTTSEIELNTSVGVNFADVVNLE